MRWFLLLAAFLSLSLTAVSAAAQTATPRINPLTGKPYSAASQAEYERQQREAEEQSRMAEEASAQDNKAFEEMRARNAEQIRQFDEAVETWRENTPPPPGTTETFVSTSYDNDTALGERAEITFYNNHDVPTHKVAFGPDGKPTGPVTQTQQGKVWETIGPRIPPGGGVETSYGEDFEGERIITRARIFTAGGKSIGDYKFNFDGVPWWGETRDPETGLTNGGFMDERLKPPEATLGGPLPFPSQVRLITGVCEPCRALADAHNDLAARINAIVIEMKSLSEQHQHAWPPAQRPIRARHDVLATELAGLMSSFEALRAKVVECEKQCRAAQDTAREEALASRPDRPAPQGPGVSLSRPRFERLPDLTVPAGFCSESERVGFMTEVYNPAVAAALSNARTAQDHQAKLNALFTETMRANSPHWAAVRAERDAFEPVGVEATARAEALRQLYSAILAVPVVPCPEGTTRTATGPVTPLADAPPTEAVATGSPTTTRPRTPKEDCPPKQGRDPIVVGPNSRVGSGAQLRSKVGGMALGALAGALGAGGGGGGGSDGPQLWTCKIKDSEYTVFEDPVTGVSLAVGAKPAKGGKMVIFSKILKSPDKGTFQTAFLERPSTGQTIAPSDVGPCDLWGEWKLTVSWTRSTYVDGQLVSQESGGWSEGGLFKVPGMLSKVDAPDGLWKRMGFSNASNGAREMGAIFDVQPGGEPLTLVVHVTRPKGDPVTTVPFILTLTRGADGKIAVTKAQEEPCPEETATSVSRNGPPATTGGETPPTRPPCERLRAAQAELAEAERNLGVMEAPGYDEEDLDFKISELKADIHGLKTEIDQLAAACPKPPRSPSGAGGESADGELSGALFGPTETPASQTPEEPAKPAAERTPCEDLPLLEAQLRTEQVRLGPDLAYGADTPRRNEAEAKLAPLRSRIDQLKAACPKPEPPTGERRRPEEYPVAPVPAYPEDPCRERLLIEERLKTLLKVAERNATFGFVDALADQAAVAQVKLLRERLAGLPADCPTTTGQTTSAPPSSPSVLADGRLHTGGLKRLVDGLETLRKTDIEDRRRLNEARCEGPANWREKREAYLKRLRGRLDIMRRIDGLGPDKTAIETAANGEVIRLTDEIAEVEAMSPPPEPQSCPVTPVPEEDESILDSIEEVFVPA